MIHSGSRHLGKQIAEHYQRLAADDLIQRSKGRDVARADRDLAYLENGLFHAYLHDMAIAQRYAAINRQAMAQLILEKTGLISTGDFSTVHNYIDTDAMILRKGAISARQGEQVLIPMNMRDGSIIAVGKGNDEWNQSAPHGAGRLMSRKEAFRTLSMKDFQATMAGIFTTTLTKKTLDEAPAAYKPMTEIVESMRPSVEILKRLRPVYNFKSAGD